MRSQLALLFFFCLAAIAPAQSVTIDFGSKGPREVWADYQMPIDTPVGTQSFDSTGATFPTSGLKPTDILFVWDKTTGNVAYKTVKEAGSNWKIAPADYKLAGLVKVRVEHKGQPVASAAVLMGDGQTRQQRTLDASSKGEADFFGIKPGQVKVEVHYRAAGKQADPLKQSFELSLKRDTAQPTFVTSIPQEVETLTEFGPNTDAQEKPEATTPPRASTSGESDRRSGGGNFIANLLTFIIVLGAALAILYFGLRWLKSNPDTAEDTLNKLGVQVPKPQGADPAAPPAPVNVAPQPPQQIVLDDAAPNIIATPTAAPISTPIGGQPRLVGDSGRIVDLVEGPMAVGREDGLPIALVGESSVSRRHAEVVRSGNQVLVRDLGSTNGTFVNGQKLTGEQTLKPGDTVQFGAVKFRYEG